MTVERIAKMIRDGAVIGTVASGMLAVMASGAWTLRGEAVVSFLRAELGIDELAQEVRTLSGEDRVIRQLRGYSYVEEPVHEGDEVFLVLHMARTQAGALCTFVGYHAVFEDQRGIKLAGSSGGPITQLGPSPERIRLGVTPPRGLQQGRVGVHLILEYRCGGETVFDRTETLFFDLLSARK